MVFSQVFQTQKGWHILRDTCSGRKSDGHVNVHVEGTTTGICLVTLQDRFTHTRRHQCTYTPARQIYTYTRRDTKIYTQGDRHTEMHTHTEADSHAHKRWVGNEGHQQRETHTHIVRVTHTQGDTHAHLDIL